MTISKSRAETCRDEGEEGACAKYGQKGEGREGERTSADKTLGERGEGGEEGRMEFQGLAAPTHTHPSARKVIKERYPRPPPPPPVETVGREKEEEEAFAHGKPRTSFADSHSLLLLLLLPPPLLLPLLLLC